MNIRYPQILLITLITSIIALPVFAQDGKMSATRMQVEYFKDHNRSESIVATLKIRDGRYMPFENAEILFYCIRYETKCKRTVFVRDYSIL